MEKKKKNSKRLSFQGLSVVVLLLSAVAVLSTGFSSWFLISETKEQTIFDFDVATTIDASGFFVVGEPDVPKKIGPEGFVDKDHIIVTEFVMEIPVTIKYANNLDEYVQNNDFTMNVSLINTGTFTNFFDYNVREENNMKVDYNSATQIEPEGGSIDPVNISTIKTSFTLAYSDITPLDDEWSAILLYKFDFNDFVFTSYTATRTLNLKIQIGVDI